MLAPSTGLCTFFFSFFLFFEQEKRYPGIEDVSLHKTLAHDSIHPNIN